jgi:AcrR family transcriptional regulator
MPPARKSKKSAPKAPADQRIIDSLLSLAAEKGWLKASLGDIAAHAGVSLAELYDHYPSKAAILSAAIKRVDHAVLAKTGKASDSETARDRLFDVLMRRLDAMKPDKDAIAAILRDIPRDPPAALFLVCRGKRSMRWMLEAAGVSRGGILGQIQVKGLTAIFAATVRVWLGDDSEDMGKTMAFLDKRLTRAETIVTRLCSFPRPGRKASEEAA